MLAQVLFHTSVPDVEVIDVIALESAVAFGEHQRGAPISLALRTANMSIVGVEFEWVDGECLTVVDGEGDAVVLQISG